MAKIDKNELIAKVNGLNGLTDDDKAQLISYIKTKTYGLVWENSTEKSWEQMKDYIPVLVEDKDKAIINDTEVQKNPNHILIEGDNLLALTNLCYTHAGKVDVIYIDPPYNTQNRDFKYNDTFVDPDDEYVHSQWLSFMDKRLRIAKQLLRQEGVLFLSIDDKEQANIKLLLDEIFGANNFVAQMIWQQGKKHIGSFIGVNHEYMLVYAHNKQLINDNDNKWKTKKEGLDKIYREYDRLKRQFGDDYLSIQSGMRAFYRSLADSDPSKDHKHYNKVDAYGLFFAGDISQGSGNGPRYDIIHPITQKSVKLPNGGWRCSETTMKELLQQDRIYFGPDETTVPCIKRYLRETEYELPSSVFYKDGRAATKEVETILGIKGIFNNPKDREIIQKILMFKENSLILDFFAGSGTTLHATVQLNAEDGGNRQCILVTNNENNICEEVTYQRNKRVIEGYTKPNGEFVEGLHNNNLRYYKIEDDVVNRGRNLNKRLLMLKMLDLLKIKEDAYEENTDFQGLALVGNKYVVGEKSDFLFIVNTNQISDIVQSIKNYTGKILKIYIFSENLDVYENEFEEVLNTVELIPAPGVFIESIKRILPPQAADEESNDNEEDFDFRNDYIAYLNNN